MFQISTAKVRRLLQKLFMLRCMLLLSRAKNAFFAMKWTFLEKNNYLCTQKK